MITVAWHVWSLRCQNKLSHSNTELLGISRNKHRSMLRIFNKTLEHFLCSSSVVAVYADSQIWHTCLSYTSFLQHIPIWVQNNNNKIFQKIITDMGISKLISLILFCLTICLCVHSLPHSPVHLNENYYLFQIISFSTFLLPVADMLSHALFIWYISQFLRQWTPARLYLARGRSQLIQQKILGSQAETASLNYINKGQILRFIKSIYLNP